MESEGIDPPTSRTFGRSARAKRALYHLSYDPLISTDDKSPASVILYKLLDRGSLGTLLQPSHANPLRQHCRTADCAKHPSAQPRPETALLHQAARTSANTKTSPVPAAPHSPAGRGIITLQQWRSGARPELRRCGPSSAAATSSEPTDNVSTPSPHDLDMDPAAAAMSDQDLHPRNPSAQDSATPTTADDRCMHPTC